MKKIGKSEYVLTFLLILFGMVIIAGKTPSVFAMGEGDIDDSKKVDLIDPLPAMQIAADLRTESDFNIYADVNGDRAIGLTEVIYILKTLTDQATSLFGELLLSEDYADSLYSYRNSFPPEAGDFDDFIAQLPDAFDWRDYNAVTRAKNARIRPITPAKSQGDCGSCYAFANVSALESKIMLENGPAYDLSEQQLISCDFRQNGCCWGYLDAAKFWENNGPMLESCTGYAESDTSSHSDCTCNISYSLCRSETCDSLDFSCDQLPVRTIEHNFVDIHDVAEVKASLIAKGPGVLGFHVFADFTEYWVYGSDGEVYVQSNPKRTAGHAVSIIGWNDRKGAWLCKNSRGQHGPNGDGTFWIAYDGHKNDLFRGMGIYNFSVTNVDSCGFHLYPTGMLFTVLGGSKTFQVKTEDDCYWTAQSNNDFISIDSGHSGMGSGTVSYTVSTNPIGSAPRVGTITAANQTFNVIQYPNTCASGISPDSISVDAYAPGQRQVEVDAALLCPWEAVSNDDWIHIVSGRKGMKLLGIITNPLVNYTVDPNYASAPRTGTMTIAGKTFTVNQEGTNCIYDNITVSPSKIDIEGGTAHIAIEVSSDCPWTVESNEDWILISGYRNGKGNETVICQIMKNYTNASRIGTITVAGKTLHLEQGNVIAFPDPKLEEAVRTNLNKSTGDITTADMQSITTLSATSVDIKNLKGLEFASNLEHLDLSYNMSLNDISTLNVLTNLKTLNLFACSISDISPLIGLRNLNTLNLGGNRIKDISGLDEFRSLSSLDLTGNNIRDISPLADLKLSVLTSLILNDNQIYDISPLIPFAFPDLETLELRDNDISDISVLADYTTDKITKLVLSSNKISDISPLNDMVQLTHLDIGYNPISDIADLTSLTNLTHLNLAGLGISNIIPLVGMTKLEYLSLVENNISDISPLSGKTNIKELYLWMNNISDISPLTGMMKMTKLDLWQNNVSDISALYDASNIEELNLSDNQITDIHPLFALSYLSKLMMNNNKVSDISPLEGLTNLDSVYLGGNEIFAIKPLVNNSGITGSNDFVYLSGNPLNATSCQTHIPALESRGVNVSHDC